MDLGLSALRACSLRATDGALGAVDDLLFDDRGWRLTHLVVDTRAWLAGRKVVLPADAVARADWAAEEVAVAMTREEVRASPERGELPPVAGEGPMLYDQIWFPRLPWGSFRGTLADLGPPAEEDEEGSDPPAPHLWSAAGLLGWRVRVGDADVGKVRDVVAAPAAGRVRGLLVDRHLLADAHALVDAASVRELDADRRVVAVDPEAARSA